MKISLLLTISLLSASVFRTACAAELDGANSVQVIHVQNGSLANGAALKAGDTVQATSELKTAPSADSYIDLKYSSGHQVRIKSDSTIRIVALEKKKSVLDLIKGKAFVHFAKKPQNDGATFEVHTPTAVAGVRGTKFVTEFDEKKGTYICVCEGTVAVRKPDGGKLVDVKSGQDLWSYQGKALEAAKDSAAMNSMTAQEFDRMQF